MEPTGPHRPDLTQRQRDIVRFCKDYIERNGYAPSMREIGAAVGLKSTSSVSYQCFLPGAGASGEGPSEPRLRPPPHDDSDQGGPHAVAARA